ncbi:hypothetical protein DL96DRAFT_636202 [Flagelloscypha sp. PMI_526]|nr:hypothetical protein DL96DRAFT_636202 [Flagelloscypha sp. PMI_526]
MVDRFSDLPTDLSHQILIHCSIHTVLAVRSCSKRLNVLTRDKYLWIRILKLVCTNIQLFFPSYPVDEMDIMQIEEAATAYLRFPKRASQSWAQDPNASIPHVRNVLLKPPAKYKMTSVSVVRGGRFLLTLDGTTMYLWDLWRYWDRPVASQKDAAPVGVRGHPCEYFEENSDRLVVRITLGPHDKQYTWYTLYEIYPASDKPTFKLLAKLETLRFQAGPCHFDLESGTVALLQDDGHHMWVWYPFDPQDEDSGQDGLVDYSVDHTWDGAT